MCLDLDYNYWLRIVSARFVLGFGSDQTNVLFYVCSKRGDIRQKKSTYISILY